MDTSTGNSSGTRPGLTAATAARPSRARQKPALAALAALLAAATAAATAITPPGETQARAQTPAQQTPAQDQELCDAGGTAQFGDITSDEYAAAYILCSKALGISKGKKNGDFGASDNLTRTQMAAFLIRLWTKNLEQKCPSGQHPFADVPDGHWATPHISCLYALGITKGTTATTYTPDGTVTAAQVTRFTARLLVAAQPSACDLAGDELAQAAACFTRLNIAPNTIEASSGVEATRAQMIVYLIGVWHHATGRGTPPAPPERPKPPSSVTMGVSSRRPAVGDSLTVTATVLDGYGIAEPGTEVELFVDAESRATAATDSDGRSVFTLSSPTGPANEGGYDSLQARIRGTGTVSRPAGVFWQTPRAHRITLAISPDKPHSNAVRTLTATAFRGSSPLAGRKVELHVDGVLQQTATTDSAGRAEFTRRGPLHGPFDLAKAVLAQDRGVVSEEVLFSWPLRARGGHSGNHWELVWKDEFNGSSLDASKWRASNNCPPVYLACETDRPANVEVSDGMLRLRALRERYTGTNDWRGLGHQFGPVNNPTTGVHQTKDFTAARIDTRSTKSFTYGRFEMLGKLPQGYGSFFAYWLRPTEDSPYGTGPSAGEMDIAEGANIGEGGVAAQLPGPGWGVHHVVHMGLPFTNPVELTNLKTNPAESFHLYAAEWDTKSIRMYIDGGLVFTLPREDWFSKPAGHSAPLGNPNAPFDVPFYMAIHNTVGNWAVETAPDNEVPDATAFPTEFAVDYVRVYECRPPASIAVPGPGQGCETR